eukprot:2314388-Prymnesium_polylepis.2
MLKFGHNTGNADTQHNTAQGHAQRERRTRDTPRPKAHAAIGVEVKGGVKGGAKSEAKKMGGA